MLSARTAANKRPATASDNRLLNERPPAENAPKPRNRGPLYAVLTIAALIAALSAAVPAQADPGDGAQCPPNQTTCDGWDIDPPEPPGDGGGGGDGPGGGGGGPCVLDGQVVPCYSDLLGWFNSSDGCYYKVSEPQPPGGGAGETAYTRTCGSGPFADQEQVWLTDPPPAGPPPPSPAEVAQRALAQIDLMLPVIRTAPDTDGIGLVGLPVWVWLPANDGGDDASWWADLRTERTERGVHVELTASPRTLTFDMGDGHQLTCENAGTPYDGKGGASPDCGYDKGYAASSRKRPGGRYTITATVTWTVRYVSGGTSGTLPPQTRENATTIRIDELQVVTG